MASKTITFGYSNSTGSYIRGKIELTSKSDTATNTSDVTAKIYVRKGSHDGTLTIPTEGTWSYSITVNGSKKSGSIHKSVLEDWVLLYTGTWKDIAHGSDGKKSISVSGSVSAPSETSYAGKTSSGSGTFTLDTIARASVISAVGNVTLGNKCSVEWTPMSASFRYKLEFTMGGWSYTTGAIHPNKTTAYTYAGYTIPLEAVKQIPNAKTGEMTVTLYTYSNSGATTQVGDEDSEKFTVTVPDNTNTKPEVSMSLAPVHSLGSAFDGLYIQGKSKVKATLSGTGKYSATIKSYSMKVENKTYDSDDGYTSGYLANYGSVTVEGYAKDSRGILGGVSQKITVIAYAKPKIQNVEAVRCDVDGNPSDSGTYLKIKAKRAYSPVKSGGVQKNFCRIRYRYKLESAESYSAWTTILVKDNISTDEVSTSALLGGVLSPWSSYLVQVQAIDDIGGYETTTIPVPTDKAYMHEAGSINSLGIGMYVEEPNTVAIAEELTVTIRGDVLIGTDRKTLKEYILAVISEGG